MKKYFILLITVLIICACGKVDKEKEEEKVDNRIPVKLKEVKKEKLNELIMASGSFESVNIAKHTSIEADVVKVNFRNGDFVKAGEVVVVLEDVAIKSNFEQAKANFMKYEAEYNKVKKFAEIEQKNNYDSVKSEMLKARENLDKIKRGNNQEDIDIGKAEVIKSQNSYEEAKFNYEKYKQLYDEELVSEATYIGYLTNYTQAKASLDSSEKSLELLIKGNDIEDINSAQAAYDKTLSDYKLAKNYIDEKKWENEISYAEANYLSAKSSYEKAKKDYDDLTVKAKIDGVLSGLDVKPYEKTKGSGILFFVIDNSKMELSIGLNAVDIIKINENSDVKITTDYLSSSFNGKIVEISPDADEDTKKIMIKVQIDNLEGLLKQGLYGKVVIYGEQREMVVVPKEAIVVKNLYNYVFRVERDKVEQVKIELGISSGNLQEIISKNINVGDKIVIDGQYLLQDNNSIKEVE